MLETEVSFRNFKVNLREFGSGRELRFCRGHSGFSKENINGEGMASKFVLNSRTLKSFSNISQLVSPKNTSVLTLLVVLVSIRE